MIIKNATVYTSDFEATKTDITIDGEIISALGKADGDGEDFSGCNVLPGFIDIHIHGCNMADTTDGNADSVAKMSKWLATKGITSFCPTTMTLPEDFLEECFGYAADTMGKEEGAYIQGINMEGPFISHAKKGAQAAAHIVSPDYDMLCRLNAICPVRLVDIAPEADGAFEFIEKAKNICTVSVAHTAADYKTGMKAFELGAKHATHLYNAMNCLTSREAGMVGAVMDSDNVMAEIICDGIHICPATLRITFGILGEDRTVVISDSLMAAGMPDGEYMLGGQKVYKKTDARLADGTLAGSVTNLFDEFHNILSYGIPFRQALKSVTINPAKAIGVDKTTGTIEVGKYADLLITSEDFKEIKAVFIKGKRVV
ncbi:MAG: N-acetylglucosamine-6-phosphate deacetylase [Clostridia bacterium]|nr:N-acetylglucosamine-6-phosphate deacetylase [Clostridia bacterium]